MRRWRWCIGIVFVCILFLASLFEPNRIVLGFLCGDDFYDWRPTRYWRQILKQEGASRQIRADVLAIFKSNSSAIPVLAACARDSDRDVRWTAVALLGRIVRIHNNLALPSLRQALKDEDFEIRLQAIISLGNCGANAMSASSDLAALMKDPELQIRFMAEKALWFVNKKIAVKEGGWQAFESARWGFSAMFPAVPDQETKPALFAPEQLSIHKFFGNHGVTSCVVAVTEYPPELIGGTDDERLDASRDLTLVGLEAKLVEEKRVQSGAVKGREFKMEKTLEKNGVAITFVIRSRVFWVDGRLYHVQATYNDDLSIVPAVDYFLESFELRPSK